MITMRLVLTSVLSTAVLASTALAQTYQSVCTVEVDGQLTYGGECLVTKPPQQFLVEPRLKRAQTIRIERPARHGDPTTAYWPDLQRTDTVAQTSRNCWSGAGMRVCAWPARKGTTQPAPQRRVNLSDYREYGTCLIEVEGRLRQFGACAVGADGHNNYEVYPYGVGAPGVLVRREVEPRWHASWLLNEPGDRIREGGDIGSVKHSGGCWLGTEFRVCAWP